MIRFELVATWDVSKEPVVLDAGPSTILRFALETYDPERRATLELTPALWEKLGKPLTLHVEVPTDV